MFIALPVKWEKFQAPLGAACRDAMHMSPLRGSPFERFQATGILRLRRLARYAKHKPGQRPGSVEGNNIVLKGQNKAKRAVVVMLLQGGKSLESPHPRALPQVRHGESVLWRTGDECRALGAKHD